MATKISKVEVKKIAISAAITAIATGITLAVVNYLLPKGKGLGSVAMKGLAFAPIEHQAKFADSDTVDNAKNAQWLVEQSANMNVNDPALYKNINPTSIGNAAYIAKYGTNPDARRKAMQFLENLRKI